MTAAAAAERAHMGRVVGLGCIVCRRLALGETPAEVHHIRAGQGWRRAPHHHTIPLCFLHHRGADGIHHIGTKAWARRFWPEADLLAEVLLALGCEPSGD